MHTLSPLGSNPGILGKSGKTPGVYSETRAPADCYLSETRASPSELCNQPGHCWFSTTAVKWRHLPRSLQHKRVSVRPQRVSKVLPQLLDTWSWLVHFQTVENQVSEQTNGNGWSSPGNSRMECFWENISALVPAFMQPVLLQWPLLYFSGELILPWHSTERERLFFVLIIYWYFMRQRKITYKNKEVQVAWQYQFSPVLLLENSNLHLIALGVQIMRALA